MAQRPQQHGQNGICPECKGTGRVPDMRAKRKRTKKCLRCRGTGRAGGGYQTKG